MYWTVATAKVLQTDGYDYSDVIVEMKRRIQAGKKLDVVRDGLIRNMKLAFRRSGRDHKFPEHISVAVNDWRLEPGKIGSYTHDQPESKYSFGLIVVDPKALDDMNYSREIVKHELIHSALGHPNCDANSHGEDFQELAEIFDLPEEYRD